ncbi:MAG: hypothetical protein M3O06_10580 [Pseudomonadota bacterium]|nr:hypothetical protein [Pseudomonadota bacterium]
MVLFNFTKKLKITRFTLDVLMQRVINLKPARRKADEAAKRLLDQSSESIDACERMHDSLRKRLFPVESLDGYAIASLGADFDELDRKISELVRQLSSLETEYENRREAARTRR